MTAITVLGLAAADNWSISIGGGWIILMLVGMAVCCLGMFGFMWLMRGERGWSMCGPWRWLQEPTPRFRERRDDPGDNDRVVARNEAQPATGLARQDNEV